MALTPNKPRKLPGGILLLILCLFSLVLMTVWSREGDTGPLHRAKSGVEVITMPLKSVGSVVGAPFRAIGDAFSNGTTDDETVVGLYRQIDELQSQLIRMEEYRQENERLLKLLELKDAYNLDAVGARVISTSPDSWHKVITINKGSAAGIEVGMPVMSANGLIGQIESVSPYSAQVRLIIDQESGVAAFLQSSRAEGILSGSVDGMLYLQFITLDVAVAPGDTVITSGAGGVFPKGIPIGEVSSVSFSETDVYQTITVKTFSRVQSYEEVLVIIGSESQIDATHEDDALLGSGE